MNRVSSTLDIGALKRLRILCISETGWFDTATVFDDIRAAGGAQSDQCAIPWPPFGRLHTENASGFSALLEAETTDGKAASTALRQAKKTASKAASKPKVRKEAVKASAKKSSAKSKKK